MRAMRECVATFSIVAADPRVGMWGVGVQSKFLAVGAVVPWAEAGVGAVATQAWANVSYGPEGLALLRQGLSAEEVVDRLVQADPGRDHRQLGVVDAHGRAAAYTGAACLEWAGHRVGPGYACQGNILAGPAVVDAMARAYEEARDRGLPMEERLIEALRAGQAAGGDRRGQQSAALLLVKPRGGYGGYTDRWLDLRVDDHPRPIEELHRLVRLHRLYFGAPDPSRQVRLEGAVVEEVQRLLQATGYYRGPISGRLDDATRQALRTFQLNENFEERVVGDEVIDGDVLDYLRDLARPRPAGGGPATGSAVGGGAP
ncbi:MAG: fimbrial assembly protein FimA [Bacillota bacterium]|nr:MAG: fimbrial assembly protein FimA [Bacillota bacterium]